MTLQGLTPLTPLMPLDSRATSAERAHFRCSFTAILPCCSAAWPAPLPLSIVTAFLGLYCLCHLLPGLLRCLCLLLLPFWARTAFVDLLPGLLRCLCLLLLPFWAWATLSAPLPLSTFTAFVDLLPGLLRYTDFDYWMSQLADHINYSAFKLHLRIPTNSVPV